MLDHATLANLNALKLFGFAEGLQQQKSQPEMLTMQGGSDDLTQPPAQYTHGLRSTDPGPAVTITETPSHDAETDGYDPP
ncbi:MAG TPA: hypothetical protein PKA20_08980 [Burkholderiaceae bacterium]|nr:hypothetical protein [Burkholderiaceae bacterium]